MHTLTWFEIPAAQLGRAAEFYSSITGHQLQVTDFQGKPMVLFPGPEDSIRGALMANDKSQPGRGTVIYLDTSHLPGGIDGVLERIPKAGGQVVLPRTEIPQVGAIGLFSDSEGNVVGLHQAA